MQETARTLRQRSSTRNVRLGLSLLFRISKFFHQSGREFLDEVGPVIRQVETSIAESFNDEFFGGIATLMPLLKNISTLREVNLYLLPAREAGTIYFRL